MNLVAMALFLILGTAPSQAEEQGLTWQNLICLLGGLFVFVICLPPTLLAMWLGWTRDISTVGKPYYDDFLFRGLIHPQPVWPWGYLYCFVFYAILGYLLRGAITLFQKIKKGRTGRSS
ncbi:MAG: hypothetical protein WC657_08630 [Candidatus Paceibacterota bacterium]|jgi:hypothetical protein